jgi:hypothetical protein
MRPANGDIERYAARLRAGMMALSHRARGEQEDAPGGAKASIHERSRGRPP